MITNAGRGQMSLEPEAGSEPEGPEGK